MVIGRRRASTDEFDLNETENFGGGEERFLCYNEWERSPPTNTIFSSFCFSSSSETASLSFFLWRPDISISMLQLRPPCRLVVFLLPSLKREVIRVCPRGFDIALLIISSTRVAWRGFLDSNISLWTD